MDIMDTDGQDIIEYADGFIVDCDEASIYEEPNAKTHRVGYVKCGKSVMIDLTESTSTYYKVYTETSIEGYCHRKYVEVP